MTDSDEEAKHKAWESYNREILEKLSASDTSRAWIDYACGFDSGLAHARKLPNSTEPDAVRLLCAKGPTNWGPEDCQLASVLLVKLAAEIDHAREQAEQKTVTQAHMYRGVAMAAEQRWRETEHQLAAANEQLAGLRRVEQAARKFAGAATYEYGDALRDALRALDALKDSGSPGTDEAVVDALVTRSQAGLQEDRFLTRAELAHIARKAQSKFESATCRAVLQELAEAAESEDE